MPKTTIHATCPDKICNTSGEYSTEDIYLNCTTGATVDCFNCNRQINVEKQTRRLIKDLEAEVDNLKSCVLVIPEQRTQQPIINYF